MAERKPEGVRAGQNGGDSTQAGMMAHNHLTGIGQGSRMMQEVVE